MDKPAKKLLRCAVYTRKSTEHNLDLEFNSLDAQREACEAYIKSQAHEGWRLIPYHYDDGAFSGASLDRPALWRLLGQVRAGNVDVIVVYKVDRLTRSLGDFAKLVELFEQHAVSFVSVTQHFNTTSSMGRLTLNVLLSFAQFEREVIGERVRDKIAASKAKGLWVGGSVPLGYASVNKKLVATPSEAETVRLIYRRYLELGSVRDLAADLDRKGIRTRRQRLATGNIRGDVSFGVGALANLLRNRFYIGEIVYRGATYPGEHEPILDRKLFDAVQAKLTAATTARHLRLKGSPSSLAGRIFDHHGNRMTPTHTNKKGARYRYYVSHAILQKRSRATDDIRISAPDIENAVIKELRKGIDSHRSNGREIPISDRDLIQQKLARIIVKPHAIDIHLVTEQAIVTDKKGQRIGSKANSKNDRSTVISVPWTTAPKTAVKGVLHSPLPSSALDAPNRHLLLTAIAKARAWIEDLVDGRVASFAEIAKREDKVERHIRLLAPLAFVSPNIVSEISVGAADPIGVTKLAKRMTYNWGQQKIR
jgi:site-specific DNA recombinase